MLARSLTASTYMIICQAFSWKSIPQLTENICEFLSLPQKFAKYLFCYWPLCYIYVLLQSFIERVCNKPRLHLADKCYYELFSVHSEVLDCLYITQ